MKLTTLTLLGTTCTSLVKTTDALRATRVPLWRRFRAPIEPRTPSSAGFKEFRRVPTTVCHVASGDDDENEPSEASTTPGVLRHVADTMGLFISTPSEEPWAEQYWADPRIHSFGNTGVLGGLHAAIAPFFTWMLNQAAYNGSDVRACTAEALLADRASRGLSTKRIVDLGTGTGPAARAMRDTFEGAEVIAVDTSPQMLAVADLLTSSVPTAVRSAIPPRLQASGTNIFFGDADSYWTGGSRRMHEAEGQGNITYLQRNAEATGLESGAFDVVCAAFLLHEAPAAGRAKIIAEARRLLRPGGTFVVLDIARCYTPSPVMKSGEPYIDGYLENIEDDMTSAGFGFVSVVQPIKGRAEQWFAQEPLRVEPAAQSISAAPASIVAERVAKQ